MQFSLVVPLVPKHDSYFFNFLLELSKTPEHVGEVIASRSGGSKLNFARFNKNLSLFLSENSIEFPVKILHSSQKLLAGENRNRAWAVAKFEFVVFCDADDSYSPYRLIMFQEAIELFNPDLLVHDYFSGTVPLKYFYENSSNLDYVTTSEIYAATFLGAPRIRSLEGRLPGNTNIRVPFKINNHVKIHHAHSCVRNQLRAKFQYGTTYRAEDGQFCRDILEGQQSVVYIPWELSTWVYSRSTAPKSRLHSIRKVFNCLKKTLASRD